MNMFSVAKPLCLVKANSVSSSNNRVLVRSAAGIVREYSSAKSGLYGDAPWGSLNKV